MVIIFEKHVNFLSWNFYRIYSNEREKCFFSFFNWFQS